MSVSVKNDVEDKINKIKNFFTPQFLKKLTIKQKQNIYKELILKLFDFEIKNQSYIEENYEERFIHFDLMKETLIQIGQLYEEKLKKNYLNNDKKSELKKVLNDAIDYPVTIPYLIPNLCQCIINSTKYFLENYSNSNLKYKQTKKDSEKIQNKDKIYTVYSNTVSKEYFESKKILKKKSNDSMNSDQFVKNVCSNQINKSTNLDELNTNVFIDINQSDNFLNLNKIDNDIISSQIDLSKNINKLEQNELIEKKLSSLTVESNKLYQLNQNYRRNQEELQEEIKKLKLYQNDLIFRLEEKNNLINEKQNQFEDMQIELDTIKVQLETISKHNQLLDFDKNNFETNTTVLKEKIKDLEKINLDNKRKFDDLNSIILNEKEKFKCLENDYLKEKNEYEFNKNQLRQLKEIEKINKQKFENLEIKEKEIKDKYEKIINNLEKKYQTTYEALEKLKNDLEKIKNDYQTKDNEIFKLDLEFKELMLKNNELINENKEKLNKIKELKENNEILRENTEKNLADLSEFKNYKFESETLIESEKTDKEKLKNDIIFLKNENDEITKKMSFIKKEALKELESLKNCFNEELKKNNSFLEKFKISSNELELRNNDLKLENELYQKIFNYIETISDPNILLPVSLIESSKLEFKFSNKKLIDFQNYFILIKNLKDDIITKNLDLKKLNNTNLFLENEFKTEKLITEDNQQKLKLLESQIQIKDCEIIHLKDQNSEIETKFNVLKKENQIFEQENKKLNAEINYCENTKIELKKQITNYQLINLELQNDLELKINKVLELESSFNNLNEQYSENISKLKIMKENLDELKTIKENQDKELLKTNKKIFTLENANKTLEENNNCLVLCNEKLKIDNETFEQSLNELNDLNKELEKNYKSLEKKQSKVENNLSDLLKDYSFLIDLSSKYNIILNTHLKLELITEDNNENSHELVFKNKKFSFIKPNQLIKIFLNLESEFNKQEKIIENLEEKLSDLNDRFEKELNLNKQYKEKIDSEENNFFINKKEMKKLIKEQDELRSQLNQFFEENEKLNIEKKYLTEKVLSLVKVSESAKKILEKKINDQNILKLSSEESLSFLTNENFKNTIKDFEKKVNILNSDLEDENFNLDDMEKRLTDIHDNLICFINFLMNNIEDYKKEVTQLDLINNELNDKVSKINLNLVKTKDNENQLLNEINNLKKELFSSNSNSTELNKKINDLTNQISQLQKRSSDLNNLLDNNRISLKEITDTNDHLKLKVKQLEATINFCEIKLKENEKSLSHKTNQIILTENEIIDLKEEKNCLENELKKFKLQNKIMTNELNKNLTSYNQKEKSYNQFNSEEKFQEVMKINEQCYNIEINKMENLFNHRKLTDNTSFCKNKERVKKINLVQVKNKN